MERIKENKSRINRVCNCKPDLKVDCIKSVSNKLKENKIITLGDDKSIEITKKDR